METGIAGLDDILYGGIPKGNVVMVEGPPGTGKTTMGMQYLIKGAQKNEPGIYITFEETPEQIAENMSNYEWDINILEESNLIKIVSFSPQIVHEDMLSTSGIFEKMIRSFNCQRIVIDSISLIKYLNKEESNVRELIYSLRNILHKHSLTALLINEEIDTNINIHSIENFVVDGIIQMSYQFLNENIRSYVLEVIKMRGTKISNYQHNYLLTDKGIHIIPSYVSGEIDRDLRKKPQEIIPTGIQKLDELLLGGVARGETFLIETDSLTTLYKLILVSISSQRIKKGEKFLYSLSIATTIEEFINIFKRYNIDLVKELENDQGLFIEHFRRSVLKEIESKVANVTSMTNEEYWNFLNEHIRYEVNKDKLEDKYWFTSYDINTILIKRGKEFLYSIYGELLALVKSLSITTLMHCNVDTVDKEILSLLESKSDGIIKIWSDVRYQYLQIIKSPLNINSKPFIIETINEYPFIELS